LLVRRLKVMRNSRKMSSPPATASPAYAAPFGVA
jgi:hypothetical protein